MKDDAQRIASYLAKTVPTTVSLKVAGRLPGMRSGFGPAITDMVAKEIQIQGICNANTVPVIQYPFYLNFGREIAKRRRAGIDGPSLTDFCEVLSVKYQAYGLLKANLTQIAIDVFAITLSP